MGQEIDQSRFDPQDFEQFNTRLREETRLLAASCACGPNSTRQALIGFELEAWLVDEDMNPAALNEAFLERLASPLASPELARFNVEFNTVPLDLGDAVFTQAESALAQIWSEAEAVAAQLGVNLLAIGTLPTLTKAVLNTSNLSSLNRYQALNEQVLAARANRPIRLDIVGHERLHCEHEDVMLEAATTSFQIHLQLPCEQVSRAFNAALLASAPLVAVGANSPFLFGRDLWAETRIPLFEQAIAVGGYDAAAFGPVKRVGFGMGYVKNSLVELFEENLQHFPVMLPTHFDTAPQQFSYLRLHNGTIWRWNRPLVGFDPDGQLHLRFEHRVLPSGPTIADMMANAALFCGLVASTMVRRETRLVPFAQVRDNFYQAAQHGLKAHVAWTDGEKHGLRELLLKYLIPQAAEGLREWAIDESDIGRCLSIIERRVSSGQTGSEWQRGFMAAHPGDFAGMTQGYLAQQREGNPVSEWVL